MDKNLFKIEYLDDFGPAVIKPISYFDDRGSFTKLLSIEAMSELLLFEGVLQINVSKSKRRGTVRGLHFQKPPFSDAKIIFCLSGGISDYLVDIRADSKTFGKVYKIKINSDYYEGIYVPKGFAHGYQTLEDDTELIYFHDEKYKPDHEAGFSLFSTKFGIQFDEAIVEISNRDLNLPHFQE